MKKFLTVEDLINFCESQKMFTFSAKNTGKPIVVQADNIAYFEDENLDESDGFMHLKFRVAHIDKNRNGSSISKENMEAHMGTLKYRPVLASIIPSPDDETVLDFNGHDMEFDKDGNVKYIESQVGCFTADEPYLEYNEEYDKTYVIGHALIPLEYTETASIIKRKKGTKVSCEILINELSYDSNNKCLNIIDFSFQGVCLLGDHVGEGMYGSRADIASIEDFSEENNSMFSQNNINQDYNSKLIETLEKLNNKLDAIANISNFNIDNTNKFDNEELEKGGSESVSRLEELMQKYNKTQEDITFETEGLSDEELEAKFIEEFGEIKDSEDDETVETVENNNECSEEVNEVGEDIQDDDVEEIKEESEDESDELDLTDTNACGGTKKKKKKCSRTYELSHDDVRYALYNLLAPYEEADNDYYWIVSVYDEYFVYQGYAGNYFGQKYKVEDESVSFDGERYELFVEFLTKSEKTELETMRSNYSSIVAELNTYKQNEMNIAKENILSDEAYAEFIESDEFKSIKNKVNEYSVDELRTACDLAFAKLVKSKGNFSYNKDEKKNKNFNKVGIAMSFEDNENKDPYGDYFKSLYNN